MFGLASLFNGISTMFNANTIFPDSSSPKVNVIAQLEFELTYHDVPVQHIGPTPRGLPPKTYT